jgi:hypothetical protein
MTEITRQERLDFAGAKVLKALKWIVLSGTATFFLTGVVDIVAEIQLPYWATLMVYLVINTTIYGIAEYVKGHNGE